MAVQGAPGTSGKRKRRKWPWILGVLVLLIVIIAATSGGDDTSTTAQSPTAGQPAAPAEQNTAGVTVTYRVTGDGDTASVTYVADENFSMQQNTSASLPFSEDIQFPDAGAFGIQPLTLTAQSMSQQGGEITCEILRDGEPVATQTSSGPFAVVTCSGS